MPNGFTNTKAGKSLKAGTFKSKSYDGKTKRSTFSGKNTYGGGVKGTSGYSKAGKGSDGFMSTKNRSGSKKVSMKPW